VEPRKPSSKKPEAQPSLPARALRLLARREHTRRELERKLAPHAADRDALAALLDDFARRGWLSEARVVEQVVHAKRGRYGPARIRQALAGRGVSEALIEPAVKALKDSELEAARAVWAKKFRTPPSSREERAKHVRFLQARGFGMEIAMRVVHGRDDS